MVIKDHEEREKWGMIALSKERGFAYDYHSLMPLCRVPSKTRLLQAASGNNKAERCRAADLQRGQRGRGKENKSMAFGCPVGSKTVTVPYSNQLISRDSAVHSFCLSACSLSWRIGPSTLDRQGAQIPANFWKVFAGIKKVPYLSPRLVSPPARSHISGERIPLESRNPNPTTMRRSFLKLAFVACFIALVAASWSKEGM